MLFRILFSFFTTAIAKNRSFRVLPNEDIKSYINRIIIVSKKRFLVLNPSEIR